MSFVGKPMNLIPVIDQDGPPDRLPCDVMLPPATIIRKGCETSMLIRALKRRAECGLDLTFSRIALPTGDHGRDTAINAQWPDALEAEA